MGTVSSLRTFVIGLAVVWTASTPRTAWGQWTGGPTGPIYYNGGNVGIGTTMPGWALDVGGTGNTGAYSRLGGMSMLTAETGSEWWTGTFTTAAGPWQLTHRRISDGFWINALTVLPSGNVGIGTTNPQYLLSVNGQIGAKDVIVTNTGWSDYVFQPGYRLRPLSEVNAYIEANHHLPDIPSEAEVQEKGVSVGDMQSKLLAKIEELTLRMIEQDKENRDLRGRVAQLEAHAAGAPSGPGAPATVR